MGFYPVEVLINDAKRHGVAVLPVDINASTLQDDDRMGRPAGLGDGGPAGDDGSHDADAGEPLPEGVRHRPAAAAGPLVGLRRARGRGPRALGAPKAATGYGVRLGLALVKGIGEEHAERARRRAGARPYARWPTSWTGPGCPRRSSSG